MAVTASHDFRLGALLARAGLLPRERLDEVLARQATRNAQLGELLVEMGVLDAIELNAVLALQQDLRSGRAEELIHFVSERLGALQATAKPPAGKRLQLGRMLVDGGVIDERTLDDAIARQKATGLKLGETLVQGGAISSDTLNAFLSRQRRLMAVAMAAASLLAAGAPGTARAGGSGHSIHLQAQVVRHASITAMRTPSSITVTAQDVERGYVDLEQPLEVDIRTNDAAGVVLGMSLNTPLVRSIEVLGEAAQAVAGSGAVRVLKAGKGLVTQTVRLRARFKLDERAKPGVIAWPVALFISPA